jgi:hypothetical protein
MVNCMKLSRVPQADADDHCICCTPRLGISGSLLERLQQRCFRHFLRLQLHPNSNRCAPYLILEDANQVCSPLVTRTADLLHSCSTYTRRHTYDLTARLQG